MGIYVSNIDDGDFLKVRDVNFGKGAQKFEASVATASAGGKIEIRIGGIDGKLLGVCEVKNTGGDQSWKIQSAKLKKVKGVHDLYFVFRGENANLFNFDWWTLKK